LSPIGHSRPQPQARREQPPGDVGRQVQPTGAGGRRSGQDLRQRAELKMQALHDDAPQTICSTSASS
jgi:hypothetical protein